VRLELVEQFQRGGPASIPELARRMGRPADSLYFHARRLLRIGVLVEQERRPTGRRPESVFALAARAIGVDPRDRSPAAAGAARRGARAVLRLASRQFEAAHESAVCSRQGPRRDLLLLRAKASLAPAALAELNRRIDELVAFLRARPVEPRGRTVALTLLLTPLATAAERRSRT
jgi:transposase-like protein